MKAASVQKNLKSGHFSGTQANSPLKSTTLNRFPIFFRRVMSHDAADILRTGRTPMIKKLAIASALSIGLLLAACDSAVLIDQEPADPDTNNNPSDTLVDLVATAEAAGNFQILLSALESANLRTVLADAGNVNTIFAPTDNAFLTLGEANVDELLNDSGRLTDTLLYHVLAGSNDAASLTAQAGSVITMLNGGQAALTTELDQLRLNTSNVISPDIAASNGIVHVIDTVLTPPTDINNPDIAPTESIAQLISNDPQFSSLLDALSATGLDTTLSEDGNLTLFAPTNDAFAELDEEFMTELEANPDQLRDLLLFHVIGDSALNSVAVTAAAQASIISATGEPLFVTIDGNSININNATITEADLTASNGVVHGIDTVLIPAPAPEPDSIIGVLAANPDYSELVSLIAQAGLSDTLNDTAENFTVFAPNNDAIAAADAQLNAGFTNDSAALGNLLLGHITDTLLTSAEVVALDGTDLVMLSGSQPIVLTRDILSIGGAVVVETDLQARNGVIHGIDAVLIP